jgi:hypothetical protein
MKIKNKALYWGLIFTFAALYLAVAFVSTLHAITFFQLANTLGLAILLGSAYEIGQASVLFSILMTENKNRFLAWLMMILLTSLQVTANVYASFKFMDGSGSNDWTYWQRAILFAVQAENAEMYKVIISWISGALLPLVALGMTALVAENIRLARGEKLGEEETEEIEPERIEEIIENEVEKRLKEKVSKQHEEVDDELTNLLDVQETFAEKPKNDVEEDLKKKIKEEFDKLSTANKVSKETGVSFPTETGVVQKHIELNLQEAPEQPVFPVKEIIEPPIQQEIKPKNPIRGWHFMAEFVDDDHNVFKKGKFVERDQSKTPTSKKA